MTPARVCEALADNQPDGTEFNLIVYAYAPHTFDMKLPDRTHLGMRLGYDRQATEDARRQAIAFLNVQGMGF